MHIRVASLTVCRLIKMLVTGPRLWNALMSKLRQTDASFDCFKPLLKTRLFSQCY